jgi:ADP-dependent NAD(P)H-hydrate dehydratase / NAD(P)H-hydrate epimerase
VLCAHAAARCGTGLVTLAVPRAIYPIVAAQCPPEVMPRPLDRLTSLAGYDALAIGPGLGEAHNLVYDFLAKAAVPTVVDADALNALAVHPMRLLPATVFTPHPGEMSRLVGASVAEVQAHRWELARQFAQKRNVVLVLKGAGTVVTAATGPLWVNLTGNPGLAKGGMGDVLTGMIGAFLAQGLAPLDAVRAGVFLHGRAGDLAAARQGEPAVVATDLIESLGAAWHSVGV